MAERPATVIDNERRAFYRLYLQVKSITEAQW
jgi:hypothetical protein